MARQQSRYVCQACGAAHIHWEGQCRTCGAWNTLVETLVHEPDRKARAARAVAGPGTAAPPQSLAGLREAEPVRTPTGISELDRVLGGGLVPGSVVLLGGEPGIGKSTLLLQAAAGLTATAGEVLYATGEESAGQVRLRAGRLGLLDGTPGERIRVVAENEVSRIAALAREGRPGVLVVDSIQSVTVDELEGPAGSVGQVRESALRLMELAKGDGIAVIVVGHVTKDGTLAGPKTLEHLVDTVLSLEGDRTATLRLLRATKNRFGSTEEVGVFEMAERGLAEVADPARAFLAGADEHAPGSVVGATLEGTRPLLVEVQGLVAPGGYGSPRRTASGIDSNRLALLIAVLGRRAGVGLGSHDVYANLAGGLDLADPGLDLPLALALASSARDKPVPTDLIAIGEVGLLGELRPVPGLERRLREAARLGFRTAIVPKSGRGDALEVKGMNVVAVSNLREAIGHALGAAREPAVKGGQD
ncbi:MAG: DNA repair protein RadA [Candidatus Limnocylindrales bacterium]